MEFVLDGFEELLRFFCSGLVVACESEDFTDSEVDAAFGGADVADAFEEFVEVVGHAGAGGIFEAFVVHDEAFEEVFAEAFGGPLAELGAAGGADAVADGEDGGERVVKNGAGDLTFSLGLNY